MTGLDGEEAEHREDVEPTARGPTAHSAGGRQALAQRRL